MFLICNQLFNTNYMKNYDHFTKISVFGLMITLLFAVIISGCTSGSGGRDNGKLSVREDSLLIPTYVSLAPNPMPRFYEGLSHQGVQRRVYPYPMNDNLTRRKEDVKYHIIYLENEFVKIGILPGLGGRIFEAIDKTNGYNFFYRQHVIKPSMIGMLGYWISGSLGWGFPHHHGPNTVEPMDYVIRNNPDGSTTVWMSYTELRHRMRILYGYTLHPNSSVVEMTIRPYNPTPLVNSFLFWANPSVHCDSAYQVIFPPSVKYITQHHKNEMNTWPVADRRYNRYDYTGVDISWWKNTGVPSSFFAWDPQDDFFGGYDHAKQAGTAWVGNHHVCAGMKYWADGNNPAGEMINDGLTDDDGRYIELMSGAYTDNQPDYSWIQPYENKDVTMAWYPIRILGGLKMATRNAALNLEKTEQGEIAIRLNATRVYKKASITLTHKGKEVYRETIDISPAQPYSNNLRVEGLTTTEELRFSLADSKGSEILSYQPAAPDPTSVIPEPLQPPLPPEKVATVEELYLNGLRLDQFYNAALDPYPYYFEALRRDPSDYRVNTQLGINYLKGKNWEASEKHLTVAKDRITMRYTRPKDSDALYYLGLVQRRLHKNKEAYDNLYDATWNAGWHSAAYHQLAEMDCENGEFDKALDHINRALSTNSKSIKSSGLKVAVLRKTGQAGEASVLAKNLLEADALDHFVRNEYYLVQLALNKGSQAEKSLEELEKIMMGRTQSYLELASLYANTGMYDEGLEVLSRAIARNDEFPMLYYFSGYLNSKLGNIEKAGELYHRASQMPFEYCFPFRDESVDILNDAIAFNPNDAMAYYYLGNMYYETQPERAVMLWEKSQSIRSDFYIVQRNLGLAAQKGNMQKAIGLYAKAYENNPSDPRLVYEYDLLLQRAGVEPQKRYGMLYEGNREVSSQRSETYLRELELLLLLGSYDEVIGIVESTSFVESEGSGVLRDLFQNVFIFRAAQQAKAGNLSASVEDMKKALAFPIGRWGSERRAQMYYLLGNYYESAGDSQNAQDSYRKAADERVTGTEYLYESALACLKLGLKVDAAERIRELTALAKSKTEEDVFRSFEGTLTGNAIKAQNEYLLGLSLLATNKTGLAAESFQKALKSDPSHPMATFRLKQ
jgi:tetratricopeptide (TPR) repeat protein